MRPAAFLAYYAGPSLGGGRINCSPCPSVVLSVHTSVRYSVCPVPLLYSIWKSNRNFKFSGDMTLDKSNKFEV